MSLEPKEGVGSPIESVQDLVSRNGDILIYSATLQTIDGFLHQANMAERVNVLRYYDALRMKQDDKGVTLAVEGLKDFGFGVIKRGDKLFVGRKGKNAFMFSSEMEASVSQRINKGYGGGEKPVYLKETGSQIDPYWFVDFIEWLALQQFFQIDELPQINTNISSRVVSPRYLYLFEKALHVTMNNVATGRVGRLTTWGLGPCVGVALENNQTGLLSHVSALCSVEKSVTLMERMMEHEGTQLSGSRFVIAGGRPLADKKPIEIAGDLREKLIERGSVEVKSGNLIGIKVSSLTLDIQTSSVIIEKGYKTDISSVSLKG